MANKTVYLRSCGFETVAHEDQVTEGLWHIPPKATEVKPPSFNVETQTCKFIDENWVVTDIPEPELEPESPVLTYADNRRNEYPAIGDQLDDLYHKGAFSDEMAAKLKKVKDDNPKG